MILLLHCVVYISVDLRTIGVADAPMIVDGSPPTAGVVNDGPLYNVDLQYTKDKTNVM